MSKPSVFRTYLLQGVSALALSVGRWAKAGEFRAWPDPKDEPDGGVYYGQHTVIQTLTPSGWVQKAAR